MSTKTTPTVDWCVVETGTPLPDAVGVHAPATLVIALEHHLRNTFPINAVPMRLVALLDAAQADAARLTKSVHTFTRAMVEACGQAPTAPVLTHRGVGTPFKATFCGGDGLMSASDDEVTCPACRQVLFDTSHRG